MLGHLGFKCTKGAGFRVSSWPPLARIQVFNIGGSNKGGAEGGPPVGGSGILPQKILKFQVLGNAISAILRQSQPVLTSHF